MSDKIIVPAAIAAEGYTLAETLMRADRAMEFALERFVRANCHKLKRERTKAPELRKEYDAAVKTYHDAREPAEAFEKRTGFSVIVAWEAHANDGWRYYRVGYATRRGYKGE